MTSVRDDVSRELLLLTAVLGLTRVACSVPYFFGPISERGWYRPYPTSYHLEFPYRYRPYPSAPYSSWLALRGPERRRGGGVLPPRRPTPGQHSAHAQSRADTQAPPIRVSAQPDQTGLNRSGAHYVREMDLLIQLASFMDPQRCFMRLICECEYYHSPNSSLITKEERMVLHAFGVSGAQRDKSKPARTGFNEYQTAARLGALARSGNLPDPCAKVAPKCDRNLVLQLRSRRRAKLTATQRGGTDGR